ncbi:MAG TPA: hypothetical protein VGD30_16280 [Telluria sp.]
MEVLVGGLFVIVALLGVLLFALRLANVLDLQRGQPARESLYCAWADGLAAEWRAAAQRKAA